ncbi:CBS domain-containing protein [Sphaerotilus hippei]|uniref:CBS domain-containing protein n=1 Tax=Sphaerotilus hippei TaxID=744406 RepID=A0A318H612_9BURK|nr:putative nucleotidyltransferase substrate binding domain-containing protein [Sphaerotilus hippei]PXW94703.1 CBS domain-containing protein [Sphaerotilus hippei]
MPSAFNFSASPYDCLTAEERQLVRDHVDIEYFRDGQVILEEGEAPSHLLVVIKGHVREWRGEEPVGTSGPDDSFDGRGLVAGKTSSRFVAAEEVLAYRIARSAVQELISRNATFGALLFADLSNKLGALAERAGQHELQSLTMARVEQAFVRPAHVVDGEADIVSVVKVFQSQRTTNVIVRDAREQPPRLGIFTMSGLQRAILDGRPLAELPVRELSSFRLITVRPQDHLFDALSQMVRHRVHRVVVARPAPDEGAPPQIIGFLEQLDLLSFLSNHSYLISLQIMEAQDLPTLQEASRQVVRLIGLLQRGGTRVGQIARLVQELNAKLFERAWQLVAPAELVANSCLFVMGSEGRGEQLLKTDQDNGLILRDGYPPPADLEAICQRFTAALIDFGYPPCPGRIMVSNPAWRQEATPFGHTVRSWLMVPDTERLMSLAIFLDAQAVAGDAGLLEAVRQQFDALSADHDLTLSRFASAIDLFGDEPGWLNRLLTRGESHRHGLDLKKAGLFPIVHGVRSMALVRHLRVTGTVERIEALVGLGDLPADLATDLIDSLHFFMGLKLKVGLMALEADRPPDGEVHPERLSSLDRDLLKDTLGVVRRFKALVRHRFHLTVL